VDVVTLVLLALGVRESRDPDARRLDVPGIGTLSLAVFGLVFYITQGPELGFTSAVELAVLGTAAAVMLAYTVPTLVLPPIAERLALRYRPSVIIPLGLYVIGGGLLLMNLGSGADGAGWATIVPGALLAGTGLGLANTPVTNTTTGSVPGDRSGMASGIDMSARLVSLAVNIAMMGLLMAVGIAASLRERLAGRLTEPQVQALAERVANGDDPASLQEAFPQLDSAAGVVGPALAQGFGLTTLYGGIAVCVIATASLITFGRGDRRAADRSPVPAQGSDTQESDEAALTKPCS
jgi:hypothetical protein